MATQPERVEVQGGFDLFAVSLPVFEGPFDLLLSLIARKKLDITEVALAQVTDEFIAFMRASPDLSRTTEFLVVASMLLEMKSARLLPDVEDEDNTSEADLEARDLLFSRLLQYRAYKEASRDIAQRMEEFGAYVARNVPLEPHFAALLPELSWTTGLKDLARMASNALSSSTPTIEVAHLHDPVVPVRQQALIVSAMLAEAKQMTFRELIRDASSRAVVVSRFLALLELYREGAVEFTQEQALGKLSITWSGAAGGIDVDAGCHEEALADAVTASSKMSNDGDGRHCER